MYLLDQQPVQQADITNDVGDKQWFFPERVSLNAGAKVEVINDGVQNWEDNVCKVRYQNMIGFLSSSCIGNKTILDPAAWN